MSEEKTIERTPVIRTKQRGRVTETFSMLSKMFREQNPGYECRWVYDPQHRPDLSGVMGRLASGYALVMGSQLGDKDQISILGLKADEPVRMSDSVLMSIPSEVRKEIKKEIADAAKEETRRIDREYYESIDQISYGDGGRMLSSNTKPRPRGRSIIEEREFAFDYVQRDSGEQE